MRAFGKNTYQFTVDFKFGCIGPELITGVVNDSLVKGREFSAVGENAETGETVLSKGDGTEKAPLFQVKMTRNQLALWAGWFVRYEQWQQWRDDLLPKLTDRLTGISVELVQALRSQYSVGIPRDKLKHAANVGELEPLLAFYRRFVPENLFGRSGGYFVFGDEDGRETAQFWLGGAPTLKQQDVGLMMQRAILDTTLSVSENIIAHLRTADDVFENFCRSAVSPMIGQ